MIGQIREGYAMASLRDEIIEAQKTRSDLLKWKLILVAGLGGTGLGLKSNSSGDFNILLLLPLIPLVCVYVDLLCRHLNLRMSIIGHFIEYQSLDSGNTCPDRDYEQFCHEVGHEKGMFNLEAWAIQWSTIVLSIFVMLASLLTCDPLTIGVLLLGGSGGVSLSLATFYLYRQKSRKLALYADRYAEQRSWVHIE